MTGPPTPHELRQRQIDTARLYRLANPDFEERMRNRMTAKGRWSLRAEAAGETAKSVGEQRRTEQVAAAADKAEQAWVLQNAAMRGSRDKERAETAATEAKALLKALSALQDDAKDRKVSAEQVAEQLKKAQRDRDRLAAVTTSLGASVTETQAMRDDPFGYLESVLRRLPDLGRRFKDQPIEAPEGSESGTPSAVVLADVGRLNSLLESVREAYVEAEDAYLSVSDRQRRLASLAATETDDLTKKYPALDGRRP